MNELIIHRLVIILTHVKSCSMCSFFYVTNMYKHDILLSFFCKNVDAQNTISYIIEKVNDILTYLLSILYLQFVIYSFLRIKFSVICNIIYLTTIRVNFYLIMLVLISKTVLNFCRCVNFNLQLLSIYSNLI